MIIKMRDMMKRKNGQKGFTLIELIVVMAILAVLAAIAVPRYASILSASKTKADNANMKMLQDVVDLYVADKSITDLTTVDTFGVAGTAGAGTIIGDGYLKAIPDDPLTTAVTDGYKVTDGVVAHIGG